MIVKRVYIWGGGQWNNAGELNSSLRSSALGLPQWISSGPSPTQQSEDAFKDPLADILAWKMKLF